MPSNHDHNLSHQVLADLWLLWVEGGDPADMLSWRGALRAHLYEWHGVEHSRDPEADHDQLHGG